MLERSLRDEGSIKPKIVLVLLLSVFDACGQSAPTAWQVVNSGTRTRLTAVAYGHGHFVAVGNTGSILTSPDGSFWTFRNNLGQKNFRDVVYGNGIFVASADTGNFDRSEIYTSSDGVSWQRRSSNNTNSLMTLSFGNGVFVASARSPSPATSGVAASTDGIRWNYTNIGSVISITFGSNLFVASGGNFQTWTSSNGVDWSGSTSFATPTFSAMTYGAGRFVGLQGNGGSSASADGISWTLGGGQNISSITGVSYGSGLFVAAGDAVNSFSVSTNGLNWTNIAFYPQTKVFDIAFANGSFVAVGDGGLILTSPNGVSWTKREPGSFISDIAYGNSTFVGLSGGSIVASPNGLEWSLETVTGTDVLRDVVFANGSFVVAGDRGVLQTSTDGLNWSSRSSGTQNDLLATTYGKGLFVAVGRQGTAVTSPDGVTWTSRNVGRTDNDLTSVAFGNQMFLALGHGGRLFTSSNGLVWSNIFQGTSGQRGVAGNSNSFVMVGISGTVLATTDGQALQIVPSGVTNDLNSVTAVNGLFGAVGKQGRILVSSNIVNWLGPVTNTNVDWTDFCFGAGLFAAVSESGSVALSGVIPPNVEAKVQTFGANRYLTLFYDRLKSSTNFNYAVGASSNLTAWAYGGSYAVTVETNDYGPSLRIGVRDNLPPASAAKRFLKLTVSSF